MRCENLSRFSKRVENPGKGLHHFIKWNGVIIIRSFSLLRLLPIIWHDVWIFRKIPLLWNRNSLLKDTTRWLSMSTDLIDSPGQKPTENNRISRMKSIHYNFGSFEIRFTFIYEITMRVIRLLSKYIRWKSAISSISHTTTSYNMWNDPTTVGRRWTLSHPGDDEWFRRDFKVRIFGHLDSNKNARTTACRSFTTEDRLPSIFFYLFFLFYFLHQRARCGHRNV